MNPPLCDVVFNMSLRKLGDSNPRYSHPYGSLANYWFQPLTQTSSVLLYSYRNALSLKCGAKVHTFLDTCKFRAIFFRKICQCAYIFEKVDDGDTYTCDLSSYQKLIFGNRFLIAAFSALVIFPFTVKLSMVSLFIHSGKTTFPVNSSSSVLMCFSWESISGTS